MSFKSRSVTVLGSTGSIGRQTLEVAEHLGLDVIALTAYGNAELLYEQARRFGVSDDNIALGSEPGGDMVICEIARNSGADVVVTAIAGEAGLEPTLAALRAGGRVALANKEPLVCAGELVMSTAREHSAEIIPVDSEHSAIFQCLEGNKQINKIILTASGGPFRGMSRDELSRVTPEMALKHPNWKMGTKVTIDSATLMNKGLEFIEAMHLFGVAPEQIEVVIHPESVIHSMVEFADGSTIAQLSNPDMRMPIQYALTYPQRVPGLTKPLNLTQLGSLTFEEPDLEAFPCLRLAFEAAKMGGGASAAMSRANEKAVAMFLKGEIGFNDIPILIEKAINGDLALRLVRS